jgi:hypothetical protein
MKGWITGEKWRALWGKQLSIFSLRSSSFSSLRPHIYVFFFLLSRGPGCNSHREGCRLKQKQRSRESETKMSLTKNAKFPSCTQLYKLSFLATFSYAGLYINNEVLVLISTISYFAEVVCSHARLRAKTNNPTHRHVWTGLLLENEPIYQLLLCLWTLQFRHNTAVV